MSSSPFEIFRRNLKPLMVALTLLALFAFVVLPVVQTSMQRGGGGGGDAVVAKFGGIELTRNRVGYFTQNHNRSVRFLIELAEETINRGGTPRTAGFQIDQRSGEISQVGISLRPSSETSVRTLALANQATDAGFELDDTALDSWLDAFTDGKFNDREIDARLMRSTSNSMARQHLYEQLRSHLLAQLYDRRGVASLASVSGGGELKSPLQQWEAFQKLRRNATVNAYGVLVNDYIEKTNESPSESEIKTVFEEGKNRDPLDQSADAAFHRRYSATFETLVGDYRKFVDEEKAKLTEEQLRAEYERRLKGGDFQIPVEDEMDLESADPAGQPAVSESEPAMNEPADQPEAETSESDASPAEPSEAGSESEKSDSESAEPESTEPEAGESESSEPEASPEGEETSPSGDEGGSESESAPEMKTDPEGESIEPKAEDSADAPADPDGDEPAESDQSQTSPSRAVRLVGLQDDEESGDGSSEGENVDAEESGKSADESSDGETASEEKEDSADKPESSEESELTGEPESDEEPAMKPAEETEPETEAEPAAESDEEPAEKESTDEPKVESFEAVRDDIAESLAMPQANVRMGAAVNEINTAMKKYFTEYSIYEASREAAEEKGIEAPVRPDLAAMAERLGFEFQSLGPFDIQTIQDEDIAQSYEAGTQLGQRGIPFPFLVFGIPGRDAGVQPLLSPVRTVDDQREKTYVTWKISETEAFTPTLEEARDEVVDFIRRREAVALATTAAEEIAKQAAEEGTSLADLVPEDRKDNYYEGLGPFTWLNPFGPNGVTIGNVPQLDSVGEDFMSAVFNTEVGAAGVGINDPERVVYVVVPTQFDPDTDNLKEQFRQPINRQIASMIASGAGAIQQGFIESLEDEMGLVQNTDE